MATRGSPRHPTKSRQRADRAKTHARRDVAGLWRETLSSLPSGDGEIIARRSGADGPTETLEVLGAAYGVTRERIRQREARGLRQLLRDDAWMEPIQGAIDRLLGRRSYVLSVDLEPSDFLAPLVTNLSLGEYLSGLGALGEGLRVYPWLHERFVITRARRHPPLDLYTKVLRAARATPWPAPYAVLLATLDEHLGPDSADLYELMLEALRGEVTLDNDTRPTTVVGMDQARGPRIIGFLREQGQPVSIHTVEDLFGRGALPAEIIQPRRGYLALSEHYPDWDRVSARLVKICGRITGPHDTQRQWMTPDLLAMIRAETTVPPWVTPMLLSAMLRQSGVFTDLGRQRVALANSAQSERKQVIPTAIEVLEQAGEPMTPQALYERLRVLIGVQRNTFTLFKSELPFLPMPDDRIGLVHRDLPGGMRTLAQVGDILVATLRERKRGMSRDAALKLVRSAGSKYRAWTKRMVASAARAHPELTLHQQGLALTSWKEPRIESRRELMARMLDEAGGRVRVQAYLRAEEAQHETQSSRLNLASNAQLSGAYLRGEWLIRKELIARQQALWDDDFDVRR